MLKLKFIFIFILMSNIFHYSFANSQEGKFIVEVNGLRNESGNVRVALYDKESDFLKDGGCYKIYEVEIKNGSCVLETENIPFGEYSVGIMHDENKNGKMDLNLIRLPKEGFGFSNNPSVKVKKPSYKETKVSLQESVKEVQIKVKYIL